MRKAVCPYCKVRVSVLPSGRVREHDTKTENNRYTIVCPGTGRKILPEQK